MVVEVLAVLDPFDPVTDFIPELEQANAALLVIANANRLDIGSPPFCKSGTCRAAKIADPRALDKRLSGPRVGVGGSWRENGHIRLHPGASPNHGATRPGGGTDAPPSLASETYPLMRQGAQIMLESRLQDIQAVSTQCHYRPYRRNRGAFGSTSLP